jgi:hypothetical protein
MNLTHPSESEIQLYSLDRFACPPAVAEHIESCVDCLEELKGYQQVFSEITDTPKPVFDFNVSQLVLAQLPQPKPHISADRFIAGFLLVFAGCFIGIPVILFNHYIVNMFSGIAPFFIYAIICCAAGILLFKTTTLYKKYRKQLELLNFS